MHVRVVIDQVRLSTRVEFPEWSKSHSDGGAVLADAAGRDGGGQGAYGEERARYRGQGQRVSNFYCTSHLL